MPLNFADFYDAELARHNRHLQAAAGAGARDRVLDIGCGAGQTTCQAARAATEGTAVGIDVSEQMLAIARQRGTEQGLANVVFEQGDAQTYAFPTADFDLCISRFGVMFFADPAAAFANIARAMRPGGRIVWMVWQDQERNEWSTAIRRALARDATVPLETAPAFSLGNPDTATDLLRATGFTSIGFTEVNEPVFYGPDENAALDALTSFEFVKNALARDGAPDRSVQRLRDVLKDHMSTEGVFFDSKAWIISARLAAG